MAEQIGKIAAHFVVGDVDQAEALDARRIDQIAALLERIHLRESRRMLPPAAARRDLARADVQRGIDRPDQRRLADARIAGQQRDFPRQTRFQRFHSVAPLGARLQHLVAGQRIRVQEGGPGLAQLVGHIQIALIEHERRRYAIRLGRHQKAVDELVVRGRAVQRHDQESLIDVRRDDMRLFRQVRGAANDVVAAGTDADDRGRTVVGRLVLDPIADHHRIGGAAAPQTQAAPNPSGKRAPAADVAEHVPAAGALDNQCRRSLLHAHSLVFSRSASFSAARLR